MPHPAPSSSAPLVPQPRRTPPRLLRLCATALIVGGTGALVLPGSAFAAGTTWRPIDPGAAINDATAEVVAPGFAVAGILGHGETLLGRYRNFQDESTGAYCIIAGLPYSEAADLAESIDGNSDPVVAYALSAYGSSSDRTTTTAVAWIAHARMDRGTGNVTAEDRRAAFTRALEDAPAEIRERVRQIVAEAEAYRSPAMDEAALRTDVHLTGSAAEGTLAAVIDVPDGHPSTVTLNGSATFADGTQQATLAADGTVPLQAGAVEQGRTATVGITVDPIDEAVTAQATTIRTYRQAGTDSRGRAFQVMAWAVPTVSPLRSAQAKISWTAPYTPPAEVSTTAVDAADGDGIVHPGGTVQDTYVGTGLATDVAYALETVVVSMADGTPTAASSRTEFTAEGPDVRVVTTVPLPADLPAGPYAVSQTLRGPDGSVLDVHDGTTTPSQQFTVGAPRIGTTATDRADGDKVIAHTGGVLVDTIAYENLQVGQEVEVRGVVMDKATGAPLHGADGAEITATARFTPAEATGTTTVEFTLDATAAGRTLVVFEDLLAPDGTVIASHRDLTDTGQTVTTEQTPPSTTPPPTSPAPTPGSTVRTGGDVPAPALPRAAGILAVLGAGSLAAGLLPRRLRTLRGRREV